MNKRIKNAQRWRGDDCGYTEFEYKKEEKKSSGFNFKGMLKKIGGAILAVAAIATAVFAAISKGKKALA